MATSACADQAFAPYSLSYFESQKTEDLTAKDQLKRDVEQDPNQHKVHEHPTPEPSLYLPEAGYDPNSYHNPDPYAAQVDAYGTPLYYNSGYDAYNPYAPPAYPAHPAVSVAPYAPETAG